jgi:mRNA interferase RelE/StbE
MNYKISYSEEVLKKDLNLIDQKQVRKILIKIDKILGFTPKNYSNSIKALKGNLEGLFRLKVGDYRVIYKIFEDVSEILILKIGHRREVYRKYAAGS